ncbi:AraC family transcriptional regulator [Lentzea aerocolonigenes]|uniref:AraC family transcriptional regulator n=1 Tax=Lentzea aerocolonigenes TaxID=68170 RepID=UPI000692288C|nr:AraC family transcriptional regulator [Lentzea aerocolonigenes]MCP2242394.1 AraC-type DNA-binding protein [Lentzea aerocolonigenes]
MITLSAFPVVHVTDLDEARLAIERTYLPHQLSVREPLERFDMRLNAVKVGALTAGHLSYGAPVRLTTVDASNFHVNIPLTGRCEQRCGSAEPVASDPGRAAVFMPGRPADLHWGPDCGQLCLMLDRTEVERELERQLCRPLGAPLEFAPAMDLTTPAARSWLDVLKLLESPQTHHPLLATHLQNMVIAGLLLTQPHNYRDQLDAPQRRAPAAIQKAVELISEAPERPWTPGILAAKVAVSVRTLQYGFKRSFDLSPMAYLREVRLDRVHADLRAGGTVAAVAARWGFFHHGRFAAAYRRKFGCLPSDTVSR